MAVQQIEIMLRRKWKVSVRGNFDNMLEKFPLDVIELQCSVTSAERWERVKYIMIWMECTEVMEIFIQNKVKKKYLKKFSFSISTYFFDLNYVNV